MSPNLKDALDNADGRFNRPPVGNIYVRYVEYAAVEGFPHVEAVARWIAAKEGIDFTEYGDALRHEAYLAGQKAKDETRTAEYHAVRNADTSWQLRRGWLSGSAMMCSSTKIPHLGGAVLSSFVSVRPVLAATCS